MKILVICQDYPNSRHKDITAFVHTRNLYYRQLGHDVDVMSFASRETYEWDGFRVFQEKDLLVDSLTKYDICVFHAPNLRNAMRFIYVNRRRFNKICLVIHGHEFLNWYTYLPEPFVFDRSIRQRLRRFAQKYYDRIKLKVWARFFRSLRESTLGVIFVSQWMKDHAEMGMKVKFDSLAVKTAIIHNPIHPAFTQSLYQTPSVPRADFITVRSFDNPKYGVDLVVEIARRNPKYTFHLYGRGRYFDFIAPPSNLTVFNEKFKQPDLPPLFAQYRCGLLPTRQDTQGVLMCEMAAFGMPLLSSNLEICREMVGDFKNVDFFSNSDLPAVLTIPEPSSRPDASRFLLPNTVERELSFFTNLPRIESLFHK